MSWVTEKVAIKISGRSKDAFRKMRYANRIPFIVDNGGYMYDGLFVFRLAQWKTLPELIFNGDVFCLISIPNTVQRLRPFLRDMDETYVWRPNGTFTYISPSGAKRLDKISRGLSRD